MGRAAGLAATGAVAAAGLRRAYASGGSLDALLSTGQTYKVLEIFLQGGADLWTHGFRVNGWDDHVTHVNPGLEQYTGSFSALTPGAVGSWVPTGVNDTVNFGVMGADTVRWGPGFRPLWMNGLDNYTRMVLVRCDLPPHEAAVPAALTGTPIGRPIGSCLGAALNRLRPSGEAPWGFVVPVSKSGIPGYVLASASAGGFHGAGNRPPVIGCGDDAIFAQIERELPSGGSSVARAEGDTLRSYYDAQYKGMLASPGGRARSRAYDAYEGSLSTLHDHLGIQDRLGAPGLTFAYPTTPDANDNPIYRAVRAASLILGEGARHCMVIDKGWDNHGGAYGATSLDYATGLFQKIFQLTHAIGRVVSDGEIDINDTLIYIHSEFSRTHEGSNGTAHSPYGYPVFLIGGPITTPGIVGSILSAPASGGDHPYADGSFGVTDVRAAVALAAGVNPWHDDMYTQSEELLGGETYTESGGFANLDDANIPVLEQQILGIP